jgi:SAM-dependent methyltransferase
MAEVLAESADDWDGHWRRYADSAARNPAQQMRHDFIARLVCKDKGAGSARLLDIGSGQGDLLLRLEQLWPGAQRVGFEASESGVAIAQRKLPRATFVVANILQPPPTLDAFADWATHAVCSEVLEHVDDPVLFLQQVRRYLAPGAPLIVTVPGGPMSAFDRHIGHRRHFDGHGLRVLLERAGYTSERIYRAGFPFFNLYRLLIILRGGRLVLDVGTEGSPGRARLANGVMQLFRFLFRANAVDSRFGWQIIAVGRKQG